MPTYTAGHGPYRKSAKDEKGETEDLSGGCDLDSIRQVVRETQSDAAWFVQRNSLAFDAWHSRWTGQTADGRKHRYDGMGDDQLIWPWEGSCDTRARTCDKIIREHMTIALFAVLNMKVQAKSMRPFVSMKEAAQATILLNWELFTKMQPEVGKEIQLALNWRFALGSSALEVCWDQQRRIDYVEVSTVQLQELVAQQIGQDGATMDQLADLLNNPAHEDLVIGFVQSMSPIVSVAQAKAIIKDWRQLRFAEIPIPYVYKSQPRWSALRLMVDLIIPASTDTIQNARWTDRVEWVTETELIDRIETMGYDGKFVDEAIDLKGKSSAGTWSRADAMAPMTGGPVYQTGSRREDYEERIELHHFSQKGHDRGVPVLYETVFHMDIEDEAKHGPCEYSHAEYNYHELRNEYHERAILSSRGIPEIAYTWEAEIKAQRDGRTDRTDLSLRPPLLAPYQDVQRIKMQFEPGVIFPERREGSMRFFAVPPYDQGSVEIERAVKQDIAEFFGLFGAELDPNLKQQRQMELADTVLEELKPPINQTFKLMQQYLPDADVVAVVGELSRPGELSSVNRADIQAQHEITATCDMRELDKEWIEKKGVLVAGILQMDNEGIIDRSVIIQNLMGAADYNLADMALKNKAEATEQERDDEIKAVAQIIGSGLDLPVPKQGANFQLRLQTLQQTLQDALQNNPATRKQLQGNPDIMKVLEKRSQYYQNQLQQQENAQIGRSLSTRTFTKQAPMLAAPPDGGMTPQGGMAGPMGGPGGGAPPGY